MSVVTEFDTGPLTWVKSEIDLALARAVKALDDYASASAGQGDPTQVKFCRTHLHQVHGALTIVGLDGVTRFAEALEGLLERIEQGDCPGAEVAVALAKRGLGAIGRYLEGLINGQPNQPLRLLPLYQEIQSARGVERVAAVDLFFPDLSVRPPRPAGQVKRFAPEDYPQFLKHERVRFQKGLLTWLRVPDDRAGPREMLAAVQHIEATQETSSARSFWWVAAGLLAALSDGVVFDTAATRQLCARIDLQIRRLLEGSRNVAERLMRDALFLIGSVESDSPSIRQIKRVYRLDESMPAAAGADDGETDFAVSGRLRDVIEALEEAWNKYCAGSPSSIEAFTEKAGALSGLVEPLGSTDFRRLVKSIVAAANWLAEDAGRHSDALAMEIATAILLTQSAAKNIGRLGQDFAHQVDVTVERIHACIAGRPPQAGSEIPLLDEMSRQAQEKLLVAQVAKEIQSNLVQIEQVLDGFFRDVERRQDLASLDTPFKQIIGVLTMLRHDGAVAVLQECLEDVRRFSSQDYTPQEADFESLAGRLSMLGFFVEALPQGESDYDGFVRRMQSRTPEDASECEECAHELSVEQEVQQSKRETQALLSALKEQPQDAGLREELRQSLVTLRNDADLVADSALGEQTKAILSVLDGDAEAAPQIEQAMAMLAPAADDLQPSQDTVQLSQASNEEIDAELLGIFLEEANEVLGTIRENLTALKAQMHNQEHLTVIRRSFHTLKGSGRMVGLKDVGEAAWAIEQTLNLWLRLEMPVSGGLLDLLDQASGVFSEWVRYLETGEGCAPDPAEMIARAEALRSGTESAAQKEPEELPVAATTDAEVGESQAIELVPVEEGLPAETEPRNSPDSTAEIIHVDFSSAAPVALEEVPAFMPSEEPESEASDTGEQPASGVGEPPEVAAGGQPELGSPEVAKPQQRLSISPALFEIFSEEAQTHLQTLRRELPALESADTVPTPQNMYRAAHTLAGISATVGLTPINQLGYALEHALLRRDHSENPGSAEALGVIRRAVGELELMLSALAQRQEISVPPGLIDDLDGLFAASVVTAAVPSESPVESPCESGESPPPAQDASPEAPVLAAVPEARASLLPTVPLLNDEIDEQLLPIFLEEAAELNQGISAQLRAWRDDPESAEIVRILARQMHTLKGSARMAGAMTLGEIAHALETRIGEVAKTGGASADTIDEIESAFEAIRQIVERLERGEDLGAERDMASDASAPAVPVAPAWQQPEATGKPPAQGFVERRADRSRLGEGPVDVESDAAPQQAILRVRAGVIDRLVNEAGELAIARSRIEGEMRSLKDSLLDLTENVIRLRRQLRDIEIQAESQMQSREALADARHAGFDPLEFDRFTQFQELTRMMAESVNDVATVQQNLLKNLDDANAALIAQARLNREVQQELMSVRMVPFNSLADRMYRIVRQTSKELNKRANLEIKGGQVELDRSVLEKIAAPLEHMLRNAIAHGLEDRETRRARGKPEIGDIALSLKQEGNEIVLALADDGAGLDYERIRSRGIAAGLIKAADDVSPESLAELIFAPGFSTAEEVSQIAGRGVGMDVVKTEVNSLGGRVEIFSTPGSGSEFRLIIPLTLAVTKALLVRAGSKTYAIPSVMIEQVLDLKEPALKRIRDAGSAEWMGHRYPFSYLPHLLGERQALPEQHRQYWTLLLRSGARRLSVQVDELLGNEEIVVKNIGPQLARVLGVDGATVLGNGQVVLILNPVALSTRAVVDAAIPAQPAPDEPPLEAQPGEAAQATLPTVMVVDDSLTVRKITGRLLAREGYQVLVAKDGVEALEQLLDVVPDVILADIEMPRMDGFDLTRNIRADARLKDVPIIMITSRTAEKHRSYAFEIGVNHYLGKPYQEEELLKLVADHVARRRQVS
jgi:chemosensory pili system protein ChpA (sensor histidine kinase/response regulator)